jgi:hypothetical protein
MGRGEVFMVFWCENLSERKHLEDLGLDEWIVLKWDFKREEGGVEWICLDQETNALVASWTRSAAFSYLPS